MNEIILSEEQMYLLKKMAQSMYPDFAAIHIGVPEGCGGCYVFLSKSKDDEESLRIHWLEFCLFYLQPTLQIYISSYVIRTMGSKYVNLLYERFKYSNYGSNQRIEECRPHSESISKRI